MISTKINIFQQKFPASSTQHLARCRVNSEEPNAQLPQKAHVKSKCYASWRRKNIDVVQERSNSPQLLDHKGWGARYLTSGAVHPTEIKIAFVRLCAGSTSHCVLHATSLCRSNSANPKCSQIHQPYCPLPLHRHALPQKKSL